MKLIIKNLYQKIRPILITIYSYFEIFIDPGMCKVPIKIKIFMNVKGFVADRYVIYNIKNNEINQFISDHEVNLSKRINKQYCMVMDNKLLFNDLFGRFINVPKIYGIVDHGNLVDPMWQKFSFNGLLEIIYEERIVIIKPIDGGGGKNIYSLSNYKNSDEIDTQKDIQTIYLNNQPINQDNLKSFINNLDQFLITEYINQHEYAKSLYKFTLNTMRIITIRFPHESKINIPVAIHRIGRESSFPIDNFDKGGISVEIDIKSGRLGRAASRLNHTKHAPIFMDKHPDTGAQITGITIPFWNELMNTITNVASKFPYLPFIAWDIVVTEKGFTAIEINKSSGSKVYQVFGGEKFSQLGEFYRSYGIIK